VLWKGSGSTCGQFKMALVELCNGCLPDTIFNTVAFFFLRFLCRLTPDIQGERKPSSVISLTDFKTSYDYGKKSNYSISVYIQLQLAHVH